jgi:hypothetical protein
MGAFLFGEGSVGNQSTVGAACTHCPVLGERNQHRRSGDAMEKLQEAKRQRAEKI